MNQLQKEIINAIIDREGGYVDDADDSGGPTRWGITERVARHNGYTGHMRDLSRDRAFEIYANRYWHSLSLDDIQRISPFLVEELADTGVNMGVTRAAEFLQRTLNVLNQQHTLYADIVVDGDIGPKTITALRQCINRRGTRGIAIILRMLNALQGAWYIELAERRQKDETFIYGWFLHRVTPYNMEKHP